MPTARELLEQADALMRRNRERALAAEREASGLATEDAPALVEGHRPVATSDLLADQVIENVEPVAEDLSRATEADDEATASGAIAPDIGEVDAGERQSEPDFPELTDIVTIGTPAPLARAYDDRPELGVAEPGEAAKPDDMPEVDVAEHGGAAASDDISASEAEASAVPQEIAEAALDQAVETQSLLDSGATRDEAPISLIEAAAARADHAPAASNDASPQAESVQAEPILVAEELPSPHEEAPAESAVAAARQEELPLPPPEAGPEVAAAAIAVVSEAAMTEPPEAPRLPDKEPWRLWSLFSFGRKPQGPEPAPEAEPEPEPAKTAAASPADELPTAESTTAPAHEVPPPERPAMAEPGIAPVSEAEHTTASEAESALSIEPPGTLDLATESGAPPTAASALAEGAPDDGVLPATEPPFPDAPAAIEVPRYDATQDNARWDALAEEVRMQVLQRIDLFTDTRLSAQLGVQLQPIVERASAELVTTINEHVGKMIRAYIAEAIEREIETWRKNNP